jgi:hypothetical protein
VEAHRLGGALKLLDGNREQAPLRALLSALFRNDHELPCSSL